MKRRRPISILAAAALGIAGLSLFFYGFELVSVPHIHEYNETLYVLAGILLFFTGIVLGIFTIVRPPRSQPTAPPAPES